MRAPHLSPFGRLLVDPAKLPREGKIDVLRGAAGMLQGFDDVGLRWLGRTLGDVLREGGDLNALLGIRPPRGSRSTARALARRADVDSALVVLANAVGVARASRILRGVVLAPAPQAELVERLRCMGAPTSEAAITRARKASRDRR